MANQAKGNQPNQEPPSFTDQLRAAEARVRAEHEDRERIAQAGNHLRWCADYATPGIAIHIYPGESMALQEERAGAAATLAANEEFCEVWVRTRWMPSIDAVLGVVAPEVVEQFEPRAPEGARESEILRLALRAVFRLYCRLMKDRGAAVAVIHDLAGLRRELGRNRYVIQQLFVQLASHVDRALTHPKDAVVPTTSPSSGAKGERPATEPLDQPVRLSAPELAKKFDLPHEALRKALERYRQANPDHGYIEVSDRRRKEPKFLYDLSAVSDVIGRLKKRAKTRDGHGA